jgi:hypothetical protein
MAALILDQAWLKPLAERVRRQQLATLKERTRSLFHTGIPPLAAIVIGGICSLAPAAIAAFSIPLSPPTAVAAFLACATALVGGGWVGVQVARYSVAGTAAFVAFASGAITTLILIGFPGVLVSGALIEQPASMVVAGFVGAGAAVVCWHVARWSNLPD